MLVILWNGAGGLLHKMKANLPSHRFSVNLLHNAMASEPPPRIFCWRPYNSFKPPSADRPWLTLSQARRWSSVLMKSCRYKISVCKLSMASSASRKCPSGALLQELFVLKICNLVMISYDKIQDKKYVIFVSALWRHDDVMWRVIEKINK